MPDTTRAWLLGCLTSLIILSAGRRHMLAMTVTAHRWPGSCRWVHLSEGQGQVFPTA